MRAFLQDPGHQLPDSREGDTTREEGVHRDFVRGVQDCGTRAPETSRLDRKVQGWKILLARRFKFETSEGCEIQRLEGVPDPFRTSHGVLDRQAHVGVAELREDRVVHEFHHRVHDTLRVDDDLHALHTNVKKPACFDHFQGLVEQSG